MALQTPPTHPPSIGYRLWIVNLVLGIPALAVVILRLIVKHSVTKKKGMEDVFIALGILFGIGKIIIDIYAAQKLELGVHFDEFNIKDGVMVDNSGTIDTLMYLPAVMFTKLSVLVLYNTIWGIKSWFRYTTWSFEVIICLYCTILFFIALFPCHSVAEDWDFELPGKCLSAIAPDEAIGALSVATDIGLLILPMPVIATLTLASKRQKIGLFITFATGILACVASIIREVLVVQTLSQQGDPTYIQATKELWPSVELFTGIICACLPPLAPLYHRRDLFVSMLPTSLRTRLLTSHTSSAAEEPRARTGWSRMRSAEEARSREQVDIDLQTLPIAFHTGSNKSTAPFDKEQIHVMTDVGTSAETIADLATMRTHIDSV